MHSTARILIAGVIIFGGGQPAPAAAEPDERKTPQSLEQRIAIKLIVEARDPVSRHDLDLVRSGAHKAIAFFQQHGFAVKRSIRVRVHDRAIHGYPKHIGLYDTRATEVALLSPDQAARATVVDKPFGMEMDRALYASFVAHELAHAILDQHADQHPVSLLAHEYIAYVAQFSTMDDKLRDGILARYPLQGFSDLSEVSAIYYALDPCAFGVKAYLHFRDSADRSGLLRKLLSGAIQPGSRDTEWW